MTFLSLLLTVTAKTITPSSDIFCLSWRTTSLTSPTPIPSTNKSPDFKTGIGVKCAFPLSSKYNIIPLSAMKVFKCE